MSVSDLHVVVPDMVDDPRRPSGGNVYDRELVRALRAGGVHVREHYVPADLATALRTIPDGADVVVDGLLGLARPDALDPRLHLALLVHLPLSLASPGDAAVAARERRALIAADGVITTSAWTRDRLLEQHDLAPGRVTVAEPGVHPAPPSTPTRAGTRLLAVGAVVPAKGQDLLVAALAGARRLPWTCRVVGPLDRDPAFVARLRSQLVDAGLADRYRLTGPLTRSGVHAAYSAADLLVVPTRLETYGMAITEALAHGVPVVAADTGGITEALGPRPGRPGVLVPADDPRALRDALVRWLTDPDHRARLRAAAAERRTALHGWETTAGRVRAAVAVNRTRRTDVVRA